MEIEEVEQKVGAFVAKELNDRRGGDDRPLNYRRQYAGFERAGKRVIYANGVVKPIRRGRAA